MNRNGSSKDFERVSSNFCNMFLQRVSSTSFFNEHPLGTPVGQVTVKASSSLWAILNNKIWKPRTETALGQNWGKVMMGDVDGRHGSCTSDTLKNWRADKVRFFHIFAVVTFTNLYNLPFFIIHIEFRKGKGNVSQAPDPKIWVLGQAAHGIPRIPRGFSGSDSTFEILGSHTSWTLGQAWSAVNVINCCIYIFVIGFIYDL
jgi:hypothetical protein